VSSFTDNNPNQNTDIIGDDRADPFPTPNQIDGLFDDPVTFPTVETQSDTQPTKSFSFVDSDNDEVDVDKGIVSVAAVFGEKKDGIAGVFGFEEKKTKTDSFTTFDADEEEDNFFGTKKDPLLDATAQPKSDNTKISFGETSKSIFEDDGGDLWQ